MVGIADEMDRSGYVHRERNPEDRRAYQVTITGPGRRVLAEAEKAVPEFLERAFAALTPAERDQLGVLLGKLPHTD